MAVTPEYTALLAYVANIRENARLIKDSVDTSKITLQATLDRIEVHQKDGGNPQLSMAYGPIREALTQLTAITTNIEKIELEDSVSIQSNADAMEVIIQTP